MTERTDDTLDHVMLFLINGASEHSIRAYCAKAGRLDDADALLAEARKRITLAAQYHRDEQLGKAVTRLEDLYNRSIVAKDVKTALQTQRELNRLLCLYNDTRDDRAVADDGARQTLDLIAGYVLPLKLMDESYPLEEHVRVACDFIRTNRV